ncbi:MAG TPA: phosphohistidine phosphatase SixA [Myxococcota bacterium]|jgi:phosphohistidine phosphatase|nr:phosphohistidine phosphatase SixA [Myxococcota bacterium]
MRLYVVRHGKAEDVGPDGTDSSRRLTEEGRREFRRAADGLASLGIRLDHLFTSPLPRAKETAEILAESLGGPDPELASGLGPGASERAILELVAGTGDEVAIVGHEPTLGQLVSLAVFGRPSGGTPLRKGGAACLEFERGPAPGRGVLGWLLTPKQLRRLG